MRFNQLKRYKLYFCKNKKKYITFLVLIFFLIINVVYGWND